MISIAETRYLLDMILLIAMVIYQQYLTKIHTTYFGYIRLHVGGTLPHSGQRP